MVKRVVITERAQSQVLKCPRQVQKKLRGWALSVGLQGLEEVRKVPGFHDEALKGERAGQRSIRLNKAYRAIYVVRNDEAAVEFVSVEEVSKHDYRRRT